MLLFHSILALPVIGLVLAGPTPNDKHETGSSDVSIQIRQEANDTEACGRMKDLWYPTAKDWRDHKTSEWFSDWIEKNVKNDSDVRLDSKWGGWAFGNPLWDCADDGSDGCEIPGFCENPVLNEMNDKDLRMAYYVTLAIWNLNRYFGGLRESLSDSAIYAALTKEKWVEVFFKEDEAALKGMREGLLSAGIAVGVAISFINPFLGEGLEVAAGFLGAFSLISNTVPGVLMPKINNELGADGTNHRIADLGKVLAKIFLHVTQFLTNTNNEVLRGDGTDILLGYLESGGFVDFRGIDKTDVTNKMRGVLLSAAINQLYTSDKIGIAGGIPCDQDLGIGVGPDQYSVCIDGSKYSIYRWETVQKLGKEDGNGVKPPHGMELLGKGDDYAWVNPEAVLRSSVATHLAGGMDYAKVKQNKAFERVIQAVKGGKIDRFELSWEGIFNIPVCNVTLVPYVGDFPDKGRVLTIYGDDQEPTWCGPVCDTDQWETDKFLKNANLWNYADNPTDHC